MTNVLFQNIDFDSAVVFSSLRLLFSDQTTMYFLLQMLVVEPLPKASTIVSFKD